MLSYFFYGLFILSCIVMIISVLLQPGKADAGALFTSSVSSTAFGPRGTQTLLAKITIIAAALFMLVALTLSLPIVTGSRSVVSSEAETTPVQQPVAPAPAAPVQQDNTAAPVGGTTGTQPGAAAAPATNTTNANATVGGTSQNANSAPPKQTK